MTEDQWKEDFFNKFLQLVTHHEERYGIHSPHYELVEYAHQEADACYPSDGLGDPIQAAEDEFFELVHSN